MRRAATLLPCFALLAAATAGAQTADDLFDAGTLHDLHLSVNSRDLEEIRRSYLENTYYTADIEWRGVRLRNIGVRSRGGASRSATKLGLKIEFDRYVSGQRFLGLAQLVLDNVWQDPALIRESLAMALFTRMGQPAPRESFARLFINGSYEGLYVVVEPVDAVFATRVFGEPAPYIFEYEWAGPFFGEYLGEALDPYRLRFKADTRTTESDTALWGPIRDLFRAANEIDGTTWRDSVARFADLPQFVAHVAIENFLAESDGLVGDFGMNNFYLYRPNGSTEHRFIPWDRDHALQALDGSVLRGADVNLLLAHALADEELREIYLATLAACARAADGWFESEVQRRAALIRDAVHADLRKPFSNATYESEIDFLTTFARRRPALVLAEVARLRR